MVTGPFVPSSEKGMFLACRTADSFHFSPLSHTEVDTKTTKEIRVIFSKEMTDRSWSWTQISKGTFPPTTGKPYYEKDKRTCVLPVKMEPGKTYVIWLNPEKFKGFRDAEGHAAVFYPLVFQTKP
jgi:RNA polymerase sigma-70 factor (ECF subfamily)